MIVTYILDTSIFRLHLVAFSVLRSNQNSICAHIYIKRQRWGQLTVFPPRYKCLLAAFHVSTFPRFHVQLLNMTVPLWSTYWPCSYLDTYLQLTHEVEDNLLFVISMCGVACLA